MPIDIVWIGSDYRIADITKNIAPETYPELFYPSVPIQYVLEVNAGWADTHGLKVGDQFGNYGATN